MIFTHLKAGSNPGRDGYLSSCMVVHKQCSMLFKGMECTVHYKEPLKSFEIRVGHSPGFGVPSVAILPQRAESA